MSLPESSSELERINSQVEITVSDTGVGIPGDFLPHVFDRFSQRDSSAGRRYGGLGLGLAITKQLVELHGGTVSAKSAGEGKGASFIVRIPLALVDDSAASKRDNVDAVEQIETAALPELRGAHILAVDDETDARELMRRALESHGARVTTVDSAEQALAVLKTVIPDVLVSDIGMPEGDGYQLMRTIRASEPKGVHVPALALTAFARSEDRKRAMLAGFDAHLAKPFDLAEFLLVIARLVNRKSH